MKTIKYIVFIPICILALGIMYKTIRIILLLNFIQASYIQFILFIPLSILIWILFIKVADGIMYVANRIVPNRKFSFWVITIICILWSINLSYFSWTAEQISHKELLIALIIETLFVIQITLSIILRIAKLKKDYLKEL